MEQELVVEFAEVSKVYKLYNKPSDRLKETVNPFRRSYHHEFYALRDISFAIPKGQTLGIVGKNGSGKSTLLKIMTGVLSPTSGVTKVKGKISALLELGAGFNPEYTGIENIYFHGTIMGLTKAEMDRRLDSILNFADIGEFIYQPVKTYSSGMFVRLAFAVAINVDPEVLIIDEALSVGDVRFQQKCFRKIEDFRASGKTVIFVSHDLGAIVKFCDRAIWINEGKLQDDGAPLEIVKKFQAFMMDSPLVKLSDANGLEEQTQLKVDAVEELDKNLDVLGDQSALITGVSLFDFLSQTKVSVVTPGQKVSLAIRVKFMADLPSPIVGFSLKDRLGNIVTQTNSYILDGLSGSVPKGKVQVFHFTFVFPNLTSGYYSVSPAVASGTQHYHIQHCWVHDALVLEIVNRQVYQLPGFIFLDNVQFNQTG